MFHLHKWTKWKDISKHEIARRDDNAVVGHSIRQERRCKKCNKVQLRKESTYL